MGGRCGGGGDSKSGIDGRESDSAPQENENRSFISHLGDNCLASRNFPPRFNCFGSEGCLPRLPVRNQVTGTVPVLVTSPAGSRSFDGFFWARQFVGRIWKAQFLRATQSATPWPAVNRLVQGRLKPPLQINLDFRYFMVGEPQSGSVQAQIEFRHS